MGCWGFRLFQSDNDFDTISELSHEAGLTELEEAAIVKFKAERGAAGKATDGPEGDGVPDDGGIYYSIFGDLCSDVPLVRTHLETGILDKLIVDYLNKITGPRDPVNDMFRNPQYVLVLLGACAMTLGCTLDSKFLDMLRMLHTHAGLYPEAVQQMSKALNGPDGYKNGEPYDFESPGLLETANMAMQGDREERTAAVNDDEPSIILLNK